MREIEFRGKAQDGKWVYGDLNKDPIEIYGEQHTVFSIRGYDNFNVDGDEFDDIVNPETIGQYTGLKDKNGKKIFEGDVVSCRIIYESTSLPHVGKIVFHDDFGAFATKNYSGLTLLHHHLLNTFQIIGNTHDNPELLR